MCFPSKDPHASFHYMEPCEYFGTTIWQLSKIQGVGILEWDLKVYLIRCILEWDLKVYFRMGLKGVCYNLFSGVELSMRSFFVISLVYASSSF